MYNVSTETTIAVMDAMLFAVNPYLEDPDSWEDRPWINDLITAYNRMYDELPKDFLFENKYQRIS